MGRKRAERGARRALVRALIFGLAALLAAAVASIGWLAIVYPKRAGPGRGREVRVEVRPDLDVDELAARLAAAGAIEDPWVFALHARLMRADHRLREGEVLLTDDMTPGDVLMRVAVGYGDATVRVVVPEGFHRFAIAARLERWGITDAASFLAATEDRALLDELGVSAPSAEGYLHPDTYRLTASLGAEGIVRRMVANHRRRAAPLFEEHASAMRELEATLSWGPHEVLVLASIIEKEAVVADERPIIARVFLNRLRVPGFSPRRLQADPTVSYGCLAARDAAPSCAGFSGTITRSMLSDRENVYNTYRHEGLPPGPISNPGLASIRAVLDHEPNRYLYFVARGQGRHAFSETLEEHNAAVARWRRR
ncbi:MAG: endolytic transglycosylase MltG [Sandaracinaceae bacterium]|nr:endolytic transglycosylase MltG [Sandaracinaceae bacterium]